MVTKATDSVLNLVSPPISNMVLLEGTLDNVLIGSNVPAVAYFTYAQVNDGLILPYIPRYGMLLANGGTGSVGWLIPGDAGTVLTSNGESEFPSYQALSGTVDAGTITGILPVPHGGTGVGTLTQYDVLLGNGTGNIQGAAPSTAGYVLTSNGGSAFPTFQAVPITTSLDASQITGVLPVPHGGTGVGTLTQYDVLLGNGTGNIQGASPNNAGYVLTSNGPSSFPSFQHNPIPIVLTGDFTYYISTSGSDGNDGSSGSPWATMQHAANYVLANINFNGHTVTIQIEDGTYNQGLTIASNVPGNLVFLGNDGSPGNVVIDNSGDCFYAALTAAFQVYSLTMSSGSAAAISVAYNGAVTCKNVKWGSCGVAHIYAYGGGTVVVSGDTEIIGSAPRFAAAVQGGICFLSDSSAPTSNPTASINPTFSLGFVWATDCGVIYDPNSNWGAIATAGSSPNFLVAGNGVIDVNGGGVGHFPGDGTNTQASGGQLV